MKGKGDLKSEIIELMHGIVGVLGEAIRHIMIETSEDI